MTHDEPERPTPQEHDSNPQERARYDFAQQILFPKIAALNQRALADTFADKLYDVLPDIFPTLIDALSQAEDVELRYFGAYQIPKLCGAPTEFVDKVIRRMLTDEDPEVAEYTSDRLMLIESETVEAGDDIVALARKLQSEFSHQGPSKEPPGD